MGDLAHTDFELGWIVGILEGEGCFSVLRQIRRNRTQYYEYPRVTLSMTDKDVVQSFKDILGISQNIHTWEQTGERLKRGHRTLYSLSVMGDTAEAIMLSVAEHMHSRRKSRIQEILNHAGKKRLEGSGEEVCQADRGKPVLVEQRGECGHRGAGVSGTGETRK